MLKKTLLLAALTTISLSAISKEIITYNNLYLEGRISQYVLIMVSPASGDAILFRLSEKAEKKAIAKCKENKPCKLTITISGWGDSTYVEEPYTMEGFVSDVK